MYGSLPFTGVSVVIYAIIGTVMAATGFLMRHLIGRN